MGYLLPALTDAKFNNQREVVLNERRQNYENRPYGLAGMALLAALYPPDHPVPLADDRRRRGSARRTSDDVRAFFQTYYHPRNASLALAGDIDVDDALRLAEKYFGDLMPGGEAGARFGRRRRRRARGEKQARPRGPRRAAAALHGLAFAGLFAADDAELDLVADVLAGGKTSRLYRALVYEQRIATEVAASQNSREIGGFFQIVATAAPGRTLAELERRSPARWIESPPTGRPRRRSSAASRRRKRTSSSGCRPSADSAASRIS